MSTNESTWVSRSGRLAREFRRNGQVWLMLLPVLLYFAVFQYGPMYGAIIAFKDYNPAQGIDGSAWVGWQWFSEFFNGLYFKRIVTNTLAINLYDLAFGFPAPIILALLLNELTSIRFRRFVQTITYLPHFISVVVVAGMMLDFLARDGVVNDLVAMLGGTRLDFMGDPTWFRGIYVGSEIWQSVGWGSIIYLASMAGIDPSLYEAAKIDGANRWQRVRYITLPGILPVVMTMLVLRLGQMMTVGFEKIILLYNPGTYETADVISTFVYRRGILEANYSFGAAVGLFNAAVALVLLVVANRLSKRITGNSVW
ncbi:binding--dependent transport system inner membrane component family protein (plasmid) [Burkholderia pseudomallei]|uniref:ABC transporter permease n=1 Tax=Burkholderia pseudomallei TaxID=28450 RepID=UPI00050FFF7A|nr:ABC transporter permease subunit [Burkholderia pseudomallei]AIV73913.1 binding--dependent transport system inner membrane component family protein [Burkholderia pseudomallei]KGD54752.1 binding--dependent transport system inner membrane component family protein [Burkholderia pseudomallei]